MNGTVETDYGRIMRESAVDAWKPKLFDVNQSTAGRAPASVW